MAEAVKNISENVAKGFGKEGAVYMAKSYWDILYPDNESTDATETAEQIINKMKQKLKGYE